MAVASAVNSGEVLGTVCQHKRFGRFFFQSQAVKSAFEYYKAWQYNCSVYYYLMGGLSSIDFLFSYNNLVWLPL